MTKPQPTPTAPTPAAPTAATPSPLRYCYHGQHSKPRDSFKFLPGLKNKRAVCSDCYQKILADRKKKK